MHASISGCCASERKQVLELVSHSGHALRYAAAEFHSDREIVLAAVSQDGRSLKLASKELKGDREIVLAAVCEDGLALKHASATLKGDREVVMAAVSGWGVALEFAAAELRADREVVLEAVANHGEALEYALGDLRMDHDIVTTAVAQNSFALRFVGEIFLEDPSFAAEARMEFYFFKIVALSGRSCLVAMDALEAQNMKQVVLDESCEKLGIRSTVGSALLYGSDLVPDAIPVANWPGSPVRGVVTEYQLVAQPDASS